MLLLACEWDGKEWHGVGGFFLIFFSRFLLSTISDEKILEVC